MKYIGITGGIGSGKSFVSRIFHGLGIAVYDADSRTKALYGSDPELRNGLAALLGPDVMTDTGVDREVMASRIFADPVILGKVNALVHPRVFHDFRIWASREAGPYVLMESALILEPSVMFPFDKIICVTAPLEVRLERVCRRDGVAPEAVKRRMDSQMPEASRLAGADYVIQNGRDDALLPQVVSVHEQLIVL